MAGKRLLQRIKGYSTISIIGMEKNVGKTTVLNYILEKGRDEFTFGLTSIGWDGEDRDTVTFTDKPGIYIEKGMITATARRCLLKSDATLEILESTGINTPMGEVIISKALSCGNIELAGPSITKDVSMVCARLLDMGATTVIVDGALGRKTSASPFVTEGAILSTGASLSNDMDRVVEETAYMASLLSIKKEEDENIINTCLNIFETSRAGVIYGDGSFKTVKIPTSLDASKEIIKYTGYDTRYVVVKGIVTDKLLNGLSGTLVKDMTLLVEDGTRIFADREALYRFEKKGWRIKAVKGINLICITANPMSPSGYEFDRQIFLEKLGEHIKLPVYDVVGGD